MYEEAQRIGIDDWEIWHNKGLCNMYLKQYEGAADCFKRANAIQRHDATYMQLGKVFTLQEEYKTAIEARRTPPPHPATSPHRQPRDAHAAPDLLGPGCTLEAPVCIPLPLRAEVRPSRRSSDPAPTGLPSPPLPSPPHLPCPPCHPRST